MTKVSITEGKRRFSKLLNRVAQGEKITLTRRGVPVAILIPVKAAKRKLSHEEIVEAFRELRRRVKPDTMSTPEMVLAGRRY